MSEVYFWQKGCFGDQCLASGFDGWLAKPFRIEDLVKIMEAVS